MNEQPATIQPSQQPAIFTMQALQFFYISMIMKKHDLSVQYASLASC